MTRSTQCIGGRNSRTRGYNLKPWISSPNSLKKGHVYSPKTDHGTYFLRQEALAQSRIISQLNPAEEGVDPGIQWETSIASNQRADIIMYHASSRPTDPLHLDSNLLQVFEVKGQWYQSESEAATQAQTYVDTIRESPAFTTKARKGILGKPFEDDWYIVGKECENRPEFYDGYRYDTRYTQEGVFFVKRSLLRCSDLETNTKPTWLTSKLEFRAWLEDEIENHPGEKVTFHFGRDENRNGIDDGWEEVQRWGGPVPDDVRPQVVSNVVINLTLGIAGAAALAAILYGVGKMASVAWQALMSRWAAALAASAPAEGVAEIAAEFANYSQWPLWAAAGEEALDGELIVEVAIGLGEAGSVGITLGLFMGLAMLVVVVLVFLGIYLYSEGYLSFGDPHLVTLDGRAYDLQAAGEFHLVRASDTDIQERTLPQGGGYSVFGGLAVRSGDDTLEVGPSGVILSGSGGTSGNGGLLPDGTLYGAVNGVTLAVGADGVAVAVDGGGVKVSVPAGLATSGLLGNHDGDPANDIATSSGELVDPSNASVLYGRYADSWRISDADSAFTYAEGKTTDSYTDRLFPASVTTLADFAADELQAASKKCMAADVAAGPALDDCIYDLVVTQDDKYVKAAAAMPDSVVGDATGFSNGTLLEDFATPVSANLAAPTYMTDGQLGRMAGPFFDRKDYTFTVMGVPRHDSLTLEADLVLLGDASTDSVVESVRVWVDDMQVFDGHLEADGAGALPAEVTEEGAGTLENGTTFHKVKLTLSVPDSAGALKVRLQPEGFSSVADTSLAINKLSLSLSAPPAQAFTIALPASVAPDLPEAGAGRLETPGSEDDYLVTINGAAGTDGLLVETGCEPQIHTDLYGPDGAAVQPIDERCEHRLYEDLPNGAYRFAVSSTGSGATYSLQIMNKPLPLSVDYVVGQRVEPGKIGGVATAGAGSLETTASKDMYNFHVDSAQVVVFEGDANWTPLGGSHLVRLSDGVDVGPIYDHHEYQLAAGDYRINVERTGMVSGYTFTSYVKPAAQSFDYVVGQRVEPGKVGGVATAGAGSLETTSSKDVYNFHVDTAQVVVFDGDYNFTPMGGSHLVRLSDGVDVGPLYDHHEYQLAAGDYRIEVERTGMVSGYTFVSHFA